jgi:hypothetical protein
LPFSDTATCSASAWGGSAAVMTYHLRIKGCTA